MRARPSLVCGSVLGGGHALARRRVVLQWIAHLVGSFGYGGVGLLMAVENVVLPLPSELIMPLAGFESAAGTLSLTGVILAGTIGSVLGALPVYAAARALGEERLTTFIDRYGRWVFIGRAEVERASERFQHRGRPAVLLSQLVPGLRGLIAIPAGFARMNVTVFVVANFAGTLVWCTILAWLGHVLGANYGRVDRFVAPASWLLLAGLLVAAVVWLLRRRRRRTTGGGRRAGTDRNSGT